MEGELLWHTLLVMVASAADHALLSALFQLFLRETLSTLSMLTHVSIAVLAQLSVLFQLFHRVESKHNNNKEQSVEFTPTAALFYCFIWRSRMNEEMRSIFECTGLNPHKFINAPSQGWQTLYTAAATAALPYRSGPCGFSG